MTVSLLFTSVISPINYSLLLTMEELGLYICPTYWTSGVQYFILTNGGVKCNFFNAKELNTPMKHSQILQETHYKLGHYPVIKQKH